MELTSERLRRLIGSEQLSGLLTVLYLGQNGGNGKNTRIIYPVYVIGLVKFIVKVLRKGW